MEETIVEQSSVNSANPRYLNNNALVTGLKTLVRSERKITSEILTYIKEVDRRRLYLEYNCTSLFGFLTLEIGYTKAAAQRRIDSARLLSEMPEMRKDIESGVLNLSQISMVAQCLRQKKKENLSKIDGACLVTQDFKKDLFDLIKNKDFEQSQKIVAQTLDLKIKAFEKKTIRAKELISHINPNPSMAELVAFLAKSVCAEKRSIGKEKGEGGKS